MEAVNLVNEKSLKERWQHMLQAKDVVMEKMTITPEIARWLLEETQRQPNRILLPTLVTKYARKIKDGEWQISPEALGWDYNGVLVEGQHRLHAIVNSGMAIDSFCGFGFNPTVVYYINQGKVRTLKELLDIMGGHVNTRELGTIARLAYYGASGAYKKMALATYLTSENYKPHHIEILKFVSEDKERLALATSKALLIKSAHLPGTTMAGLIYYCGLIAEEDGTLGHAEELVEGLATGYQKVGDEEDGALGMERRAKIRDVIWRLREHLRDRKQSDKHIHLLRLWVPFCFAWNKLLGGDFAATKRFESNIRRVGVEDIMPHPWHARDKENKSDD
jgi:hypothetical protein